MALVDHMNILSFCIRLLKDVLDTLFQFFNAFKPSNSHAIYVIAVNLFNVFYFWCILFNFVQLRIPKQQINFNLSIHEMSHQFFLLIVKLILFTLYFWDIIL